MNNGWIKLHRKIRENEIWEKEPFDKRSAWIDLLLRATHKEEKFLIGNTVIKLKSGEVFTSEKKLAKNWKWSRHKVRNFFILLEQIGQIGTPKRTSRYTLLTIVNWEQYQSDNSKKDTKKDIDGTSKGHPRDTYKNVKNGKNVKKEPTTVQKNKINFDFDEEIWENITDKDKNSWREAYPACDIDLEIKQMKEWLLSNPDKRKTLYRKFITNWFKRSQDRGGTRGLVKENIDNLPDLMEE